MMNVRVDTSEKVANLLVLARRAKNSGDSETAAKYYEMVLFDSPNCTEAVVFNGIYNAFASKGKRISIAFNALKEILLQTISESDEPELITDATSTILELLPALVDDLVSNMTNAMHALISGKLNEIDVLLDGGGAQKSRQAERASQDADASFEAVSDLVQAQENSIYNFACSVSSLLEKAADEYCNALINMYKVKDEACYLRLRVDEELPTKEYVHGFVDQIRVMEPQYMSRSLLQIEKYEKAAKEREQKSKSSANNSNTTTNSSGGCYIATCVYGSYDCPPVWTLRRFRDDTLAKTWYGRTFIKTYYAVSPMLVKYFGGTSWFKAFWKAWLDRMVQTLQKDGVDSSAYVDR